MEEYSMLQEYLISCIKSKKKPSSKIISQYNEIPDYISAYCLAYNIDRPHCSNSECDKLVDFLNTKKGFRKYCSKKCAMKAQSERNRKTNSKLNENNKNRYKQRYIEYEKILLDSGVINDYNENLVFNIKDAAKKANLPYGFVRSYFSEKNITNKTKAQSQLKLNIDEKFIDIDTILSNKKWISEKLEENWTAKTFADYLGCSPNYVCKFLRNENNPLPKKNSISSYEIKIRQLLESLNIQFETNKRNIIPPYELDIYIPDHNLAIEINGSYWHSIENKDKYYHLKKTEECKKLGINLIHLFDFEIDNKFDIICSIIKTHLHLNKKVYARKCIVKEISSSEYRSFLSENHIQGPINSKYKMGLFYENNLISVIGFSKARYNKKYSFELDRFCNKKEYTVIGGASKLFKYFISNNQGSIITYSQKRLFTGNLYTKLGFIHSHDSNIGYFWSNGNDRISRLNTQKHKLSKSMTEKEFMNSKGYHQIFDCGNSVFLYNE